MTTWVSSIRRSLLLALAGLATLLIPARATADVLPASDVYREVSELIQDLIHHQVGVSVAQTLQKNRVGGRYFRETTDRLKSHYWGSLDAALEEDLIELAVDFAFFVARNPKSDPKTFWDCVRAKPNTLDACGFENGKTLFEQHCGPAAMSIECDVARTLQASLQGREELARNEAVNLFSDLVLRANMEGAPDLTDVARFRQSIRAWMTAPEGLREQLRLILEEAQIPEATLLRRDVECSVLPTATTLLDPAPQLKCFDDGPWRAAWESIEIATVEPSNAARLSWKVADLRPRNASTLAHLLQVSADLICTAPEVVDLNTKLKKLKDDLVAAALAIKNAEDDRVEARAGLEAANDALKQATDEAVKAQAKSEVEKQKGALLEAETAKKIAEEARNLATKANDKEQGELKIYFKGKGVDCGGGRSRYLPGVPIDVQVGDVKVTVDMPPDGTAPKVDDSKQSTISRILVTVGIEQAKVNALRQRIAATICAGCALKDHLATMRRALGAADLLLSMPLPSRERMLGDVANAVELGIVLGADENDRDQLKTLAQVLRAARRDDHRQLAAFVLEALWPSKKNDESQEAMYQTFFKAFAAYLMDARKGSASGQSTATAFREAAKDVLIRLNKRGVPSQGYWAFYPVTPSLRFAWNQTYDGGRRSVAGLDAIAIRWAPSKYGGIGGAVLDLLGPFAELALRDQKLDYDAGSQGLVALNLFQPKLFIWVAAPEFSRYITIDASVAYRPASAVKDDADCSKECKATYSVGNKALDHVEMTVGTSVIF